MKKLLIILALALTGVAAAQAPQAPTPVASLLDNLQNAESIAMLGEDIWKDLPQAVAYFRGRADAFRDAQQMVKNHLGDPSVASNAADVRRGSVSARQQGRQGLEQ